jgi:hypothetical protein
MLTLEIGISCEPMQVMLDLWSEINNFSHSAIQACTLLCIAVFSVFGH